jgi:hypothetical protein
MKRTPMLLAILAASAIALGAAGTAGAHDLPSAFRDQCPAHGDQTIDQGADSTCVTVDQTPPVTPPVDQGMKQDGQTGTDMQGATPVGQNGTDSQTMPTVDPSAMPVGQNGTDSQTMPTVDPSAMPVGQTGTDSQTTPNAEPVTKDLGQTSTDDKIIQMPDDGAAD